MCIIFISGCIGEKYSNPESSANSSFNQQHYIQKSELIIKPSEIPGYKLVNYNNMAVSNSSICTINNYLHIGEGCDQANYYNETIPTGNKHIYSYIIFAGDNGGMLIIQHLIFDSNDGMKERIDQEMSNYKKTGQANIGDYSIWGEEPISSNVQNSEILFMIKNNFIRIHVIDGMQKGHEEALRIAKIIESRLE